MPASSPTHRYARSLTRFVMRSDAAGHRPRFHVVWVILVVCAAVTVAAFTSGTARALGPCTDVQIIGLRGSSEAQDPSQHNMGALVGPVADDIASLAPGAQTVSFYGVPYDAKAANVLTVLDQQYFASEHQGRDLLHAYLSDVTAACPAMKLVVVGYSQGAHAAGDQLATEPSSITNHIAALVMFGDPRFNPGTSYANGSFDARDHGLAGPRSTSDFASWSSRVGSWCNQNDIVCQGIGIGHSSTSHHQAVYLANYGQVVAGFVRHRLGWPVKVFSQPLDVAFAIDSTGSMGSSIGGVKSAAETMAQTLAKQSPNFRVGLVDYKDTNQGDPYASRVDTPFTSDISAFVGGLSTLSAAGGGDTPEGVYSGIMTAIHDLSWRAGARKAIIVMGDAPGKDPEPVTGFTRAQVVAAARALDPAVIYPISIGTAPTSFFGPLADGSGGKSFEATDPSQVSDQVLAAVQTVAVPLSANLTVSNPTRPGSPVLFSAAGSYYGSDGSIVSYDWDFNGDGITDQTTATPQVSHVYTAAFSGQASVTVHTNDGHTATALATVDVRDDAPLPASPPRSVTATPGSQPHSLEINWQSPTEIGGGTLAGYELVISDSTNHDVVAALGTGPADTSITVTDLPSGRYDVTIRAVTDAGEGQPASTAASLAAFDFTGFFPPVSDPPAMNTRHAGAALPLKFSLHGDHGLDILAAGSPSSRQIDCTSHHFEDAPTATRAAGGGLKYDRRRDQYVYVWKTSRAWGGTCRELDLTLSDGSVHSALVRFRGRPHHNREHD